MSSCKNCVFATYEAIHPIGDIQSGCQLGILDIYASQGTVISNKENYKVIEDRVCLFGRGRAWAVKQTKPIKEVVREEVKPTITTIMVLSGDGCSEESISLTLSSICKQNPLPKEIVFVNKTDISFEYLHKIASAFNIPYTIHKVLDKTEDLGETINLIVSKIKTNWYHVIDAGYAVESHVYNSIDRLLNEDFEKFLILYTDPNSFLYQFVNIKLHQALGGNSKLTLLDKTLEIIKEHPEWKSYARQI